MKVPVDRASLSLRSKSRCAALSGAMLSVHDGFVPNRTVARALFSELENLVSLGNIGKRVPREQYREVHEALVTWPMFEHKPSHYKLMLLRFVLTQGGQHLDLSKLAPDEVQHLWLSHKPNVQIFINEGEKRPRRRFRLPEDLVFEIVRRLDPLSLVQAGRCSRTFQAAFQRAHRKTFDDTDPKLLLCAITRPKRKQHRKLTDEDRWTQAIRKMGAYSMSSSLMFDEQLVSSALDCLKPSSVQYRILYDAQKHHDRPAPVLRAGLKVYPIERKLSLMCSLARGKPSKERLEEARTVLSAVAIDDTLRANGDVTSKQRLKRWLDGNRRTWSRASEIALKNPNCTEEMVESALKRLQGDREIEEEFVRYHRNATVRFLLRHFDRKEALSMVCWRLRCI